MSASQSPSLRGSGRFRREAAARAVAEEQVSIPFIAGQWSLPKCEFDAEALVQSSQSPSLRGSGRFFARVLPALRKYVVSIPFIAGQWSLRGGARRKRNGSVCLNPLHCGAVVASARGAAGGGMHHVSQSPSLRGSGRFGRRRAAMTPPPPRLNPLHCGAVVASRHRRAGRRRRAHVSIPFIAGQWSLRVAPARGRSGRAGLNPLHCGAVVASMPWTTNWRRSSRFNPLHCGAVVASEGDHGGAAWSRQVSIPFIAGQWSLQFDRPPPHGGGASFNPLHCGAVVASTAVTTFRVASNRRLNPLHCGAVVASTPSPWCDSSPSCGLNPLHCGAVVASVPPRPAPDRKRQVSIPFIAGQWSLHPELHGVRLSLAWSQSPSLRGSGRFSE